MENIVKENGLNSQKYTFDGSAGSGNRTNCPWAAIFDTRITNTAQRGFYPVYLFKEDGEGVYLSLNQGVTEIKENYKKKTKIVEFLESRAKKFRQILNLSDPENENIILSDKTEICKLYVNGNIYSKYYDIYNLPDEETLLADLNDFLNLYNILVENYLDKSPVWKIAPGNTDEMKYLWPIFKKKWFYWDRMVW